MGVLLTKFFTGVKREREPKGIFGCLAYAKVFVRGKQEPKGRKVVFLGHSDLYDAAMVRSVDTYKRSLREYYASDIKYDITQFPYKKVLVPRPQTPPLDIDDVREIDAIEEEKKDEEFVSLPGEVVSGEVSVELSENENENFLEEKHNTDTENFLEHNTDTERSDEDGVLDGEFDDLVESTEVEEGVLVPDMEVHSEYRRNPVRGARGSSEKALIRNQIEDYQAVISSEKERKNRGEGHILVIGIDPVSRKQALASPEREEWLKAEKEEIASMYERDVWELVPRHRGMNVLGCRFV
jgi:hypothetical protein